MPAPLVLTRPPLLKALSGATMATITVWAVLDGDLGSFGVIAYPLMVAIQTLREWTWRLEISPKGVTEAPGIGPIRTYPWTDLSKVIMPDAVWWRLNPVIEVAAGTNIQLTAGPDTERALLTLSRRGLPADGTLESVTMWRSALQWVVVLLLALGLLVYQVSLR